MAAAIPKLIAHVARVQDIIDAFATLASMAQG